MEDKLIEILESYGYPVRRQGSLAENEEYPDDFFTFWNADSYDSSRYDGKTCGIVWDFDVNFYSSNPAHTYFVLESARKKLKSRGFSYLERDMTCPAMWLRIPAGGCVQSIWNMTRKENYNG